MTGFLKNRLSGLSLGTQLVSLLLLAVIAAQIISIWLFHDERKQALVAAARDNVLMRAVSMVRLLEETPEQYHPAIVEASSSGFTAFFLSTDPVALADPASDTEEQLQDYLGSQFSPPREVHLDLQTVVRSRFPFKAGPDAPRNQRKEAFRLRHLAQRQMDLSLSVRMNDGSWLNVATSYRPPKRTLVPLLVQLGLTIAAVVLIVWLAVRQVAKPLRNLAGAAEQLGRGEDIPALTVEGPREVRAVTTAFNEMQARLTRFVSDRTRMLAAISHDLRTPITSLRLRAEFIDDDENREKIIETLDEMAQMTEATLAFARDEAATEAAQPMDLGNLLSSLADDQQDLGHDVMAEDNGRLVIRCRPFALKRALRNVIENGVRYGTAVRMSYKQQDNHAVIRICDQGPGIPAEKLTDVFEPFVRLETSRSEETGGIGLGLAITRSIIHAHGGTIDLTNKAEGGLEAVIWLPLGH